MIDPSQLPPGPPPMPMGSPGPLGEAMAPAIGAGPLGPPPAQEPMPPGGSPVMAADGMPSEPEKKPPLLLPPALARQMAQGYVDQARTMAGMIADQTGPPEEFERMKVADQVRAWNKRNPKMDPYALKEEGLSPSEIRDKVYPLRRILLKMSGTRPTERARFAQRMKAETTKSEYNESSDIDV